MERSGSSIPHCLVWGTYDVGKPRVRIMLAALRQAGFDVTCVHDDIWSGVEDKSQLSGFWSRFRMVLRLLWAYPLLVLRFLRAPAHDVVIVPYMGQFDVVLLWPFARLRGQPVIWDAFLSLYDTVARDRAMVSGKGFAGRLLYRWEWLACRAADRVVLDTAAHARMFAQVFDLPANRLADAFVGCEDGFFNDAPAGGVPVGGRPQLLFYGQFIPLHGIETIVAAALSDRGRAFDWHLVGSGQDAPRIDAMLAEADCPHIRRTAWIGYAGLAEEIARADICLGIFGQSEKAAQVIPNKVFQIIASGRPLVTRESAAMREIVAGDMPGTRLVAAGEPDALLDGVESLCAEMSVIEPQPLYAAMKDRFRLPQLAMRWQHIVDSVLEESTH